MPLTEIQEDFCLQYVANGYHVAEAYAAAHPDSTMKSAQNSGYRYMKIPEVKQRIEELRKEKLDALSIDADRVLEKLAEIAFAQKGDKDYRSSDQLKALQLMIQSLGLEKKKSNNENDTIEIEVG